LFLGPNLGAALRTFVKEEEVFCKANLAKSVLASGGDGMREIIFTKRTEDGDAI